MSYWIRKSRDSLDLKQSAGITISSQHQKDISKPSELVDQSTQNNKEESILIDKVFNRFKREKNQDNAHDAILIHLRDRYKNTQKENLNMAIKSVEKNISASSYWIRNSAQANTHSEKEKTNSTFIRDYMHVTSPGGTLNSPLTIKNQKIKDNIIESDFANEFDNIVKKINDKLLAHYKKEDTVSKEDLVWNYKNIAHRDAIQLIPSSQYDRFGGAKMQYTQIKNNEISSEGDLQGIFATDGSFENVDIVDNTVSTNGKHVITINGYLSGKISGNKGANGKPLPKNEIVLRPLRIGGGGNYYIIGFDNGKLEKSDPDYYEYAPLKDSQALTDIRNIPIKDGSNWKNVNMKKFKELYKKQFGEVAPNKKTADLYLPQILKKSGGIEVMNVK